jgi:hypothetical protein
MIPNLAGAMATSPVLIQTFIGVFDKVHGGSFAEPQIQTVLLTDAVTYACTWTVALHTALGVQPGLDPADVEAMRAGRSPSDTKLGALSGAAQLSRIRGRSPPGSISISAPFGIAWVMSSLKPEIRVMPASAAPWTMIGLTLLSTNAAGTIFRAAIS